MSSSSRNKRKKALDSLFIKK